MSKFITTLQVITQFENYITEIINSNNHPHADDLTDGTTVRSFLYELSHASDRLEFCGPELTDFLDDAPNLRWHVLLEAMRNV